jgi:hypothetical protein
MKPLIITLAFIITIGCASKDTSVQSNNDSLSVQSNVTEAPPLLDSAVFIAEATYASDTHEFYTPVFAKKEGTDAYEKLDSTKATTSNGITRNTLSRNDAQQYFYLKGIDNVMLYDKNNQLIGNATLDRIDYVDDDTESEFVAVYKPATQVAPKDGFAYCISNEYTISRVPGFSSETLTDANVNSRIAKELKLNGTSGWVMNHLKIMPSGNIYSIVTKDTRSLIVETTPSAVVVLKEVNNDYHFGNMIPLPILSNGKPVLLISFYVPESDITGNFTAIYNGSVYHEVHYSRVPLKDISTAAL